MRRAPVPIPIAQGFYISESPQILALECDNFYPNISQVPGSQRETLFGTPGIVQLTSTGEVEQNNRGSHVKNGIPYYVNGNSLYRLDRVIGSDGSETFSTTVLGIIEGSDAVSMADNGAQLMILVPGGKGYIYNENDSTPFQAITDPDFTANGNPQYVVYIDGYFAITTDSKKWIISALNNGLDYDALDFTSAESDPDIIVAPIVFRNQIYIAGSETTETFRNAPTGAGFPFIRANVFMNKGCFAPLSLIAVDNTFMMIGGGVNESPAIWQFTGSSFAKVSTTAIDQILDKATDEEISEAFSFAYAQKGAYFIGFTVGNNTFVYDIVTSRWHTRSSRLKSTQGRWRVNSLVTAYGRVLVGDFQDGRIGELDSNIYTEYSNNIIRTVSTQPFSNQGGSIRVPNIELTFESGVGNEDEPDPLISMSYSDDGKTFGYERTRRMGKIGQYQRRATWKRNGRFKRFGIFRWRLSDPVKPVIIKAEANLA